MLIKLLITLTLSYAVLSGSTKVEYDVADLENVQTLFKNFMLDHNKQYAPGEESQRFLHFLQNLETINSLNRNSPHVHYDINLFSDLSDEEWDAFKTRGLKTDNSINDDKCPFLNDPSTNASTPALDWRDLSKVTAVKNQGACGSCWAFSATANVESQYAIKHGMLMWLSEQQILDCSHAGHCYGGDIAGAITYLQTAGGQELEDKYPYTEKEDTCHFDESEQSPVHVTGCNRYNLSGDEALKELLYQKGPLAIGIDDSPMRHYKHGIVLDCDFGPLNHAVLLVGYGTENGVDFWIIKNSYSMKFGELGYFRVKRGHQCMGIGTYVVSSTVY